MKKGRRREILLGNGKFEFTDEPADWIIACEENGVWQFVSRGSLYTYDPAAPESFNVECMTRLQAKSRLDSMHTYPESGYKFLKFKAHPFSEFKRVVGKSVEYYVVESVDQAAESDQHDKRWRDEKRLKHMRLLFKKSKKAPSK